jgi:hypothetical protein
MDYRHWECEEEICQENATRKNPSLNDSGTNSGKDKKKSSSYNKYSGSCYAGTITNLQRKIL